MKSPSVLQNRPLGDSGKMHCLGCHSSQFWSDSAGNEHCETCSPPISELFVVSRKDYSTQADAETSPPGQCPLPSSPTPTPPPIVTPKQSVNTSIFTDGQWWAAADRMLAKLARRNPSQSRKESQQLTENEKALIDWARNAIAPDTDPNSTLHTNPLPSSPIRLAPHHTILDPRIYLTNLLQYFDSFLCRSPLTKPPDFRQRLADLEKLRKHLSETLYQ